MAGAVIGALRVTLGIDTAAFEEGLGIAQKRLAAAGKNLTSIGDSMKGLGGTLSVALTAPLAAFAATSVSAANESAAAIAQVNAALASMGPVAGKTSEQLSDAAAQLQSISTFDDDDILKSVTANMLTFGKVTGEAFDRAQLAAVNLSARLGQDLQSSAIMVGKALNDPIKGVTALSRVGVSFTADQKAMIKEMAAAGDVAGAQAIILGELEKQYGGAAKAARDATPGADTIDQWREFQETVGAIVKQVLPPLTAMLTGVLAAFNGLDPGTQEFVVGMAAVAAAVGPVLVVLGSIASAVGSLLPVFAPVIALIGEAGLGAALGAAATAAAPFIAAGAALVGAWMLVGDKVGPVLAALWQKTQDTLGPKLGALLATVKTVLTDLWNGPFGAAIRVVITILGEFAAAYTSILGEALLRILSALVSAVQSAFKIIGDLLNIVGNLLKGDFSAAWQGVKTLVADVINGWIGVLQSLAPEAIAALRALYEGVKSWIGDKLTAIWEAAKEKIQALGDKFKWLWDVVVGHSYIPDLFDGIQAQAARFTPEFVAPITAGIDEVAGAFEGLTFDMPQPGAKDQNGGPLGEAQGDLREGFRHAFSDGVRAALDGDLSGFFRNWFESIGSRAFENILNSVSDTLFDVMSGLFGGGGGGGSGGGLGGLLTNVLGSIFGGTPGFALGGGFTVGGAPGRDANLVAFRATRGEKVTISDGDDAGMSGPSSLSFNFYGPVTNPEQVKRSAAQAGAQLLRMSAAGKRGL
jgi:phage-related protein